MVVEDATSKVVSARKVISLFPPAWRALLAFAVPVLLCVLIIVQGHVLRGDVAPTTEAPAASTLPEKLAVLVLMMLAFVAVAVAVTRGVYAEVALVGEELELRRYKGQPLRLGRSAARSLWSFPLGNGWYLVWVTFAPGSALARALFFSGSPHPFEIVVGDVGQTPGPGRSAGTGD